jgi:hypothetical protein
VLGTSGRHPRSFDGYSPSSFVSFLFFYGEKDNQYYLFVSKTGGLMDIGHHFESFTVGNRDLVDRYILSQNWNWFKIYSHGFMPKWIMARQCLYYFTFAKKTDQYYICTMTKKVVGFQISKRSDGTIASLFILQKTVIWCFEIIISPSQRTSRCRKWVISPIAANMCCCLTRCLVFFYAK